MTALLRGLGLALAIVLAVLVGQARAAEEIRAFDVVIEVQPDGAILVTETLRIMVEGRQIKRGINRDLPLWRGGSRVALEVLSVRRNGAEETYKTMRRGSDLRLRIGKASRFLPTPSEQVYEIRYRSQGQLQGFEGFDELYWNVTGDRWEFPILSASVEVRLPTGIEVLQHAGYTGPPGAQGADFRVVAVAPGLYRAAITAPLRRGEGFTVAVGWPPGAVEITGPGVGARIWAAVGATLIGTLALFLAWLRVGRDPPGGAIYARFEPPADVGPAAARYVFRMGFDGRCLTAAIVSMAVKGALGISERPGSSFFGGHSYCLQAHGSGGKGLTTGERAVYYRLFAGTDEVELTNDETNGKRVDEARAELKSKLWEEHYGASFRRNTAYALLAVLAGIVAAVALFGSFVHEPALAFMVWGAAAGLAAIVTYGLGFLAMGLSDLASGGRIHWGRLLGGVLPFAVLGFLLFNFVGDAGPEGLLGAFGLDDLLVAAAGGVFGAAAILFHFLMAAPSKAGRALLDHLQGFALYLRTAEEDRLNLLHPPEHTPALFEKLLPYAVALGLAHEWSAKFAGVLSSATAPGWYDGSDHFDIDAFDRDFGHAVASTTMPSSSDSSGGGWSSGSGGGGFSGGGGGGGGGSGW